MILTKTIQFETQGECDITDITPQVADAVAEAGASDGTVTVFVTGSTAGVTTIEYEAGLVADTKEIWQKLVPKGNPYHHDACWGDGNGYSHVRAAVQGASLTVPFAKKKLLLGTWQQIVVLDFDNRPRARQVVLQVMGE